VVSGSDFFAVTHFNIVNNNKCNYLVVKIENYINKVSYIVYSVKEKTLFWNSPLEIVFNRVKNAPKGLYEFDNPFSKGLIEELKKRTGLEKITCAVEMERDLSECNLSAYKIFAGEKPLGILGISGYFFSVPENIRTRRGAIVSRTNEMIYHGIIPGYSEKELTLIATECFSPKDPKEDPLYSIAEEAVRIKYLFEKAGKENNINLIDKISLLNNTADSEPMYRQDTHNLKFATNEADGFFRIKKLKNDRGNPNG